MGRIFKGDPTFEYVFKELPRSAFLKIVEYRKAALEKQPTLTDLL